MLHPRRLPAAVAPNVLRKQAHPNGWNDYTPTSIIDKYRHPANAEEWDRYPNTDWEKARRFMFDVAVMADL